MLFLYVKYDNVLLDGDGGDTPLGHLHTEIAFSTVPIGRTTHIASRRTLQHTHSLRIRALRFDSHSSHVLMLLPSIA